MKKLLLTLLLISSNYTFCSVSDMSDSKFCLLLSCMFCANIANNCIIRPCKKIRQKISPTLYGEFGVLDRLHSLDNYAYQNLAPALQELKIMFPDIENIDSKLESLTEEELNKIANSTDRLVWYQDPIVYENKLGNKAFHKELKRTLSRAKKLRDIPSYTQEIMNRLQLVDEYGPILNKIHKMHNTFFEAFHRQQLMEKEWKHALYILDQNPNLDEEQLYSLYQEISYPKSATPRLFSLAQAGYVAARKSDKYPNIQKDLNDKIRFIVALHSKIKDKNKETINEKIRSKESNIEKLAIDNLNAKASSGFPVSIELMIRQQSLDNLKKYCDDEEKVFSKLEHKLIKQ